MQLSIVRCLDTQAKCEIKVEEVFRKNSQVNVREDKGERKRFGVNNFRSNEPD